MGGIVGYEGSSAGTFSLSHVKVTVTRGFGIATENLDVTVDDVVVQGPITGSDDPILDQLGEQINGSEYVILGFVMVFG